MKHVESETGRGSDEAGGRPDPGLRLPRCPTSRAPRRLPGMLKRALALAWVFAFTEPCLAACDPETLLQGNVPYWQHKSTPDQVRAVYQGVSSPDRIMRIQVWLNGGQTYVFSMVAAEGGAVFGGGGLPVLNLCGSTNGAPSGLLARAEGSGTSAPRLVYAAPASGQTWLVISARDCGSFGDGRFGVAYWRDSCVTNIQAAVDTSVVAITDAAGYGGTGTLVAREGGAFVPYVLSCDSLHSGAWNWGTSKVKITFQDGTVRWAEHVANEGTLGLWRLESGFPFRRDYSRYFFCGWKRELRRTEPSMLRHFTRVGNNPGNPAGRLYGALGELTSTGAVAVAVYDGPGKGEWVGTGASGSAHREPGSGRVLAVTQAVGGGHIGWDCDGHVVLGDRVLTQTLGGAFRDRGQLGEGDSAGRKGGRY